MIKIKYLIEDLGEIFTYSAINQNTLGRCIFFKYTKKQEVSCLLPRIFKTIVRVAFLAWLLQPYRSCGQ